MKKQKTKNAAPERSPALDLIRCFACFGVISVHFLWNNGFYGAVLGDSERLHVMVYFRAFFMCCVPLFMILSGYLLCHKEFSADYYKRFGRIFFTYVAASAFCLWGYPFLYKCLHGLVGLPSRGFGKRRLRDLLFGVLGFSTPPYAWYVEMYLGLFLFIPFLNQLYRSIRDQRQKQILLLIGIGLTSLPGVLNSFNFSVPGWWSNPAMLNSQGALYPLQKLIPGWWAGFYPITYYLLGCYFREYRPALKPWKALVLLVVTVFVSGRFSLWRSRGIPFVAGSWTDWNSLFTLAVAVLVFLLLLNLDPRPRTRFVRSALARMSDLSFGAYLVSWAFDQLFYPVLNSRVPVVSHRLEYYFLIVPAIYLCSMGVSFLIQSLYRLIRFLSRRLFDGQKA